MQPAVVWLEEEEVLYSFLLIHSYPKRREIEVYIGLVSLLRTSRIDDTIKDIFD